MLDHLLQFAANVNVALSDGIPSWNASGCDCFQCNGIYCQGMMCRVATKDNFWCLEENEDLWRHWRGCQLINWKCHTDIKWIRHPLIRGWKHMTWAWQYSLDLCLCFNLWLCFISHRWFFLFSEQRKMPLFQPELSTAFSVSAENFCILCFLAGWLLESRGASVHTRLWCYALWQQRFQETTEADLRGKLLWTCPPVW